MKIIPTAEECSNIILGTYAGASFYNTFDKILYDKNCPFIKPPIDISTIERINDLHSKIQSHWNKKNSHDFKLFASRNIKFINDLFNYPKEYYKKFILSLNIKGIQNTKISKILHIFKPNEFPMLDPAQGEFLIGDYKKNSRDHLIEAIDSFYKYYNNKNNLQKTKKIEDILVNSYGVNISCLRVAELLLWIQTQLPIKDITQVIIKKGI